MPETKAKPPKPSTTFTSWKLTLQQAAISDPRIGPSDLRLFLFILHRTWEKDRCAIVHDELIMALVPGFAVQSTIYRARKRLEAHGWWTYKSGSGTAATVYHPVGDEARGVLAKIRIEEARIDREKEARKRARKETGEPLHLQHKAARERASKSARRGLQIATHPSALNAGISPCHTPFREESIGTVQDLADHTPAPAPVPARAYPPVISEFDSAALRAELLGRELPRSQSGAFMCIDCGNETQLAARYKSEPFNPHCPDCIEASAFPDVKPIAGQPSYAEASRGE